MRQTTLCVPLEVKPDSCARLVSLIEGLKQQEDHPGAGQNFKRIIDRVPVLHFMSMSVFLESDYDPIFIIEANFDGKPGPFWAQLEALIGEELRHMIRCCKEPRDSTRELYKAVTKAGSVAFVAPYLEARTARPSVFHHGNRGLSRDRILAEKALFLAIARTIDPAAGPSPYRGIEPSQVHRRLRQAMLDDPTKAHAWLDKAAPPRISLWDRTYDFASLTLFLAAVVFLLALPGLVLVGLNLNRDLGRAVAGLCVVLLLFFTWRAWADQPVARGGLAAGALALLLGWFGLAYGFNGWWLRGWWPWLVTAAASIILLLAILALWLRGLELRDSPHDRPELNERIRRKMLRREDWVTQNHMGSIVLIKPGALRSILIHLGHWGLHRVLRCSVDARAGFLGSMRTVHFAHWAFLNNHSRLLFCSNFDHSWDSYLDDFIEKAHIGLTLAWSCGVGFPTTWLLFGEGATQGRQFKSWALASRTVSRFWFSAYSDLTVDQIERHHRIANGLRKPAMSDEEARTWMRDL